MTDRELKTLHAVANSVVNVIVWAADRKRLKENDKFIIAGADKKAVMTVAFKNEKTMEQETNLSADTIKAMHIPGTEDLVAILIMHTPYL